MQSIHETIVKPAAGELETKWLLLITILILLICTTTISLRTKAGGEKETTAWQINAFHELNSYETGVFNALQTAALEIEETHDLENARWMEVRELRNLYIPPFVKDTAYYQQGEIVWTLNIVQSDNMHIALYLGHPQKHQVKGSFLLLMLHEHNKKQGNAADQLGHAPYEIWFHDNTSQVSPTIITDQAMIAAGWKEIVSLTGEDEVIRTKGKTIE